MKINYLRKLFHRNRVQNQEDTHNCKSQEYFDRFPYTDCSFYALRILIKYFEKVIKYVSKLGKQPV